MTAPQGSVRHRGGQKDRQAWPDAPNVNGGAVADLKKPLDTLSSAVSSTSSSSSGKIAWDYIAAITVLTVLAFLTRFWLLNHPNEVVFDEVHFGKFASYYLQRTYFFDVHPPFGKLLFALMGWLVGYDGHFHFDNIGDSYVTNEVPYVAFRAMPAILGAMTIPTVFLIMWEAGYSLPACIVSASLVLFDNAHIGQTRLILLDATLVFAMSVSVLCYVKFYKCRHDPFSQKWWKWLVLTGVAMSCVISTKYVGVFTFFTVGSAVAIDLWGLFDINRPQGTLTLQEFAKHFFARATGLIIVPFMIYLFWFQVHFMILTRSGPGDDFMTPAFQETLSDNIMAAQSVGVDYYDIVSMRHKETKTYLHSHTERYPLRYDDGRVSSQGQQVTGYPFNDTNNYWQILPNQIHDSSLTEPGKAVLNGDFVKLRHVGTDTYLLSHDVASPYYPTNQEFTTVDLGGANEERYNDTLFQINIENGKAGQGLRSMAGQFKLVHAPSRVAMWTHTSPLPEWAFKQAEINGNKNLQQTSNIWFVEEIPSIPSDSPRLVKEERKIKSLPFLVKYLELQRAIFFHNNALTSSHPYASQPIQWPFLLRGVSFWTHNDTRQQIYFLGNPVGWWIASSLLAVFAGIVGADQLSLRRGIDSLDSRFFFLCWAAHYLPFFLMGRQLFLHHYLPAHLASALVTGALLEFIFCLDPDSFESPSTSSNNTSPAAAAAKRKSRASKRSNAFSSGLKSVQGNMALWAASGVVLSAVLFGWYWFLPLTYGKPGLDVAGVNARKWLNYDLHFAK